MFDWIKNINKEYPEFWKEYLSKFDEKSNRYVILNLATTGLNPKKDVILSIGTIGVYGDVIRVNDALELIVVQYKYLHDNGLTNDFLIENKLPKFPEPLAIEEFLKFIGNAVLVGHRIHFDIEMINEALEKMDCGKLKNEALDVEIMHQKLYDITNKSFTLNQLIKSYKVPQGERNSVLDDSYSIAILFLKLKAKLGF